MRLVFAALIALLLIPSVQAQGPEDYYDDEWENYNPGACGSSGPAFEGGGSSREISYSSCSISGGEQGGRVEMMQMLVSLENGARMNLQGMSASGSQQGGSVNQFTYTLDLLQVVEFTDTDGNGKYIPGDDELIETYSLNGGWSTIRKSEPGGGGIHFEADHPIGDGKMTLAATASGSSFRAGTVSVKPLDTKIDFMFRDYDYTSSTSQLALVLHVASSDFAAKGSSFSQGGAVVQSSEIGVVGSSGSTSVYFTWAKTADVDGVSKEVGSHVDVIDSSGSGASSGSSSATASTAEAGITLAYPQGNEIIHDPRLGVQFNVQKDSPSLPMAAGLAIFAAAYVCRRRLV